ncbi:amino acid adenylation domain-containing protein [Actinoplanes sp. NPDC051851]|uniref:amino acid adenylation domain-containing protein n=1 Tax=Actinoplanes sp. NPDC051851 TaxID=3154753 RepID=UPI0034461EED
METAALELVTDRPRVPSPAQAGAAVPLRLPPATVRRLAQAGERLGTGPRRLLLVAYQLMLGRQAGVTDVGVHADGPARLCWTGRENLAGLLRAADPDPRVAPQDPRMIFAAEAPEPVEAPIADLTLRWRPGPAADGSWPGRLEYDPRLFDPATVRWLATHLITLLDALLAEPHRPVGELAHTTAGELAQLARWGTAGGPDRAESIVTMFRRQVADRPQEVALEFADATLTYAQLWDRAQRVAATLLARGVTTETVVGLAMAPSARLVIAVLGVLAAGGTYLPLDPGHPAPRLDHMVRDSGAALLITDRDPGFAAGPPVLRWADAEQPVPSSAVLPQPHPGRRACVFYTSGSTGQPKGTEIIHRAVVGLVHDSAWAGFTATDRVAQVANVSFDAATIEIWGALLNGGRLVGIGRDESLDPVALGRRVARHGITAMFLTTALFNRCVDTDPAMFAPLRVILFGGEAADPRRAAALRRAVPGLRVANVYGPTEVTSIATCYDVPGDWPVEVRVPIGRPIAETTAAVLDPWGRPTGIGVPGELHLGGPRLARGYLGRPGLTAQRFVAGVAGSGARLYRTGDVARWRPDGQIEFLGRTDDQVKIRGVRIEPDEIAAVLTTAPGIGAAAVTVGGEGDGRHLVAHVVAGSGIDRHELRSWLAARLPEAMVPAFYVVLPELPVTPNGKLDRRALPAPGPDDGVRAAVFVPPAGPVQQLIAGIWAELLGVPRISATDDFFALGGHSLLAAQVVSRIAARLGVELGVRAAFAAPTVEALAGQVATAACGDVPAPVAGDGDGPLPVSPAQHRLWFLDRLTPGRALYNVPLLLTIDGPLDVAALTGALSALVRRHAALRTRIVAGDGEPRQVIDAPADLELPVTDLRPLPGPGRDEAAAALVHRLAAAPFDLAAGPLLRAALVRVTDERHLLTVAVHHIVSDGWSIGVLLRELGVLYTGGSLPPPAFRYADYVTWQHGLLDGPLRERQLAHWRQALHGAPPLLDLPVDRPRPEQPRNVGERFEIRLAPELAARLRETGRAYGVTPFMILLTAFQLTLGRYAGVTDVSVGIPVSGRTHPAFEQLIGFFVNTVVVRARWTPRLSFAGLLHRVREATLGAYEHQDVPFEQVVAAVRPPREPGRTPLFQVMMSMQNVPETTGALPGLRVGVSEPDVGIAKFDLTVGWDEAPLDSGAWRGHVEYDLDLFDRATAERLAGHYLAQLDAALRSPESPLGRLPMLAAPNPDGTTAPAAATVPQLFAAAVAAGPRAVAVRQDGDELTYADLAGAAERVAAALHARGIGPGDTVAVATGRSLLWPVALLGVLRAGAAYVPIDPLAPRQRRDHLVGDSGARLVLDAPGVRELAGTPARDLPPMPDPGWPAYVLYTSGSTGAPKGVVVGHGNLAHTVQAVAGRYDLRPADRALQFAALTFDVAAEELFTTLIRGATVVLLPDGPVPGIPEMTALAARERLTVLNLPASYWHEWVPQLGQCPVTADLRLVVVGSERVDGTRLEQWRAAVPDRVRWLNAYGPTEATITATVYEPGARHVTAGTVPIGQPLPGVRAYVLDGSLHPVPPGVPGELYLAGPGVAQGYTGDPAKTGAAFLADPWGPPGSRMYATRDRARRTVTGVLEFLGRTDDQVKLRGFRIEPGEIEAALTSHPRVREAAVLLREDRPGHPALTGYVVADGPLSAADLRAHLDQRLPGYLVPAAFLLLDRLPRGERGKIDRASLPAPEGPATAPAAEQPTGALERTVAGVWCEVLSVDRVGMDDNFFDLGGHSLLLVRVQGRLVERLGRPVAVVDLLRHPTVRSLARRLATGDEQPGGAAGRRRAETRVSQSGRAARLRARSGNGDGRDD